MTADDNNPSIWGGIKKSFLNSISVPLETQKYNVRYLKSHQLKNMNSQNRQVK